VRRRFDFRLARVRRIRELEELIARTQWGEAQAEANDAAATREARRAELDTAREELALLLGREVGPEPKVPRRSIDPRAVTLSHELIDHRVRAVRRAEEEVLTKQAQADRLARAWGERDAHRKSLERLEDRDRQGHLRELERADAKEADERTSHRREEDA